MSIGIDQYFKMTSEYAELVGKYFRHFKGGIYYVTGVSVNCDDLTPLVEYFSVEPVAGMKWVRKAEEFISPRLLIIIIYFFIATAFLAFSAIFAARRPNSSRSLGAGPE